MAEEAKKNENVQENNQQGKDAQAPFIITDQYIKNAKFENPGFLIKYQEHKDQPQVTVNVETAVGRIQGSNYEVTMKVNIHSDLDKSVVFDYILEYCALVVTNPSLDAQSLEAVLMVHCPFLMFPFVRSIVADVTRTAGYPPLLIDPIDFAALYIEKKQKNNTSDEIKDKKEAGAA